MGDSSVPEVPTVCEDSRSNSWTIMPSTYPLLHNSPVLSDIQFIFKNNENNVETKVYGHKVILAKASPVFKKIFFEQNLDFTITVEGPVQMGHHPFTAEAFLTFTKFLYTDKINYEELSAEVTVGILHCAEYYAVPCLKIDCFKQLEKIIAKENVIQLLETAILFTANDLTGMAFSVIQKNLKFVFESEEILSVKMETLVLILKRDSLDIDEYFILDLALKWAEHECNRKDLEPTVENKRKVLGEVFLEIRYALLTADRISELVHSGYLTLKESMDIFCAVHRPQKGPPTTTAGSNFKRFCPEVSFKSNPRLHGQRLELNAMRKMVAKWKEVGQLSSWASVRKVHANLCMSGFVGNETEGGLKNYISRPVFSELQVHRLTGIPGSFHVQFLYNPCVIKEANLFDPDYYDLVDAIEIKDWANTRFL